MNFQVLPNWCKKLGLAIFITASLLTGGDYFMDGFNNVPNGTHHYFKDLYSSTLYHLLYISPVLGILIYLFSKEKVEDDFINLLRLQSYQLTITIFLLTAVIIYLISHKINISLEATLELFMIVYLIIFYFKKRQIH
ncbi:hypothetical protein [Maribacter sp. LLG6340-A2]|uniref:hypothetical protein n=1 Tax=Maribacter sp. LLG6340-A2 TaxID=3160834 RepID=UPI003869239C